MGNTLSSLILHWGKVSEKIEESTGISDQYRKTLTNNTQNAN